MKASNFTEIEKRGARICGNDDLIFVACTKCGQQYLYNQETLVLYTDPQDLSISELNIASADSSLCIGCADPNWDFEEIPELKKHEVESGLWRWAC